MGASLLAKAVCQVASMLNVPTPSRASSLPQVFVFQRLIRCTARTSQGAPCSTSFAVEPSNSARP
ncbi:hypothetical protein DBR18_13835 [Pseudomonas sp. HMWF021]|nr:hypothetical protein DBR18_13835 [Pseudomonas sp. HMWF021]